MVQGFKKSVLSTLELELFMLICLQINVIHRMIPLVFCRYESRRVITRIGHNPTAFYLILSGFVLVNIPEKSQTNPHKTYMTTVNQLGQGEAFGVSRIFIWAGGKLPDLILLTTLCLFCLELCSPSSVSCGATLNSSKPLRSCY